MPTPEPDAQSTAASLPHRLADPALTVDARGRLIAWNDDAADRLGLDAGWVGRPLAELAPPAGLGSAVRLPIAGEPGNALVAWPGSTAPGPGSTEAARADAILRQRALVLERLAGSAWHELAQPLGGLRGFVSMLRLEGWTQDQLGVDPALVEQAGASAERLARTLTDLARGSARAAPIHAIVADLLALAGHLLVDVAVETSISADAPDLDVDAATVRLVVASLLVDRIEALGGPRQARGRLRLTASEDDSHGRPALALVMEDEGAPPSTAISDLLDALLAEAGGGLEVEGGDGTGSRILARLPVREADAGPEPATGPEATPRPVTVLVCDDESAVRTLLVRVLERSGLRVLGAGTGDEALGLLDREAVDVVLADHHMAGMSGRDLHEAAARRHPHLRTRFVLMSGDAGDLDLVAFAEREGLRVLAKPFELGTLPATLIEVATR